MSEAQAILKMIEVVDPGDDIRLDMIDDYVDVYLNAKHNRHCGATGQMIMPAPFYSRSRDTLKSIRPEGWMFRLGRVGMFNGPDEDFAFKEWGPWQCITDLLPHQYQFVSEAATEELAELHAIIQAIEYERKNKQTGGGQ